tara:strand:- start:1319 stop:1825 length:507 start_codon:yes stop_codon:yes gene_type:complete
MAKTRLHNYSVQEKLNKMDTDVITVTLVSTTNACATNEVIFQGEELENIVSVKGGACVIQSIGLLDDDDNGEPIDLVFFDSNVELDDSNDGTTIDAADGTIPDSILGVVNLTNYFDGVNWQYGHKENIGLTLKAASDTKSVWVAGVNRGSSATWTASGLRIKVGVIKD